MIDLLETGMGAVARVVEKVAHAFDLFAPGTDDGDGLVRDVRDTGADILHDQVGSGGHPVDALNELAGPFDDDDDGTCPQRAGIGRWRDRLLRPRR